MDDKRRRSMASLMGDKLPECRKAIQDLTGPLSWKSLQKVKMAIAVYLGLAVRGLAS